MLKLRPLVRGLVRQPAFSSLAILTLGLGIGVNVAIFSALEALILNPLPFPQPDRLVAVYEDAAWLGYPKNTPALANFVDWKRYSHSFEDMAATSFCLSVFSGDAQPEEVGCRNVTANIWPMVGVRPLLGRWFTADEDHPQPDAAVISEGLWTRRFGRDPNIVQRAVQINGRAFRITGVMPAWFHFAGDRDTELWLPAGFTPQMWARRTSHFLTCYGRLKPGVSVRRAEAELQSIQATLNRQYPNETDPRLGVRLEPLREALTGDMRTALWILMGAAATVLLIACANVASLLLARATRRRHEMAVRTSLGASPAQLMSQVIGETVILAFAGAALGSGLALASRRLLENFVPMALKGTVTIALDPRLFAFAILISLAAAALAALAPALHTLGAPLTAVLRQDSRSGASRGSVRMRGALVITEIALTVTLLAGAGLMIRSLLAIWNTTLGFHPENLIAMRVSLPAARYKTDDARWQFYETALEKIRAIPGVRAADFASTPPFFSIGNSMGYAIEGMTPAGQYEKSDMLTRVATPGYLDTIGARLVAGRPFILQDRAGALDVAIVNETFAHTFFPGSSPIGKRMRFSDTAPGAVPRWRTIVGIVREVKERGYDPAPKPVTYVTVLQMTGWNANQLVVRSAGGSGRELVNPVRHAILSVDPDQPVGLTRTFDEILALDQASRRQLMFLLAVFAGLSLAMACFGVYAILAYTVELRRQEIGVRMALGAARGDVVRLVTGSGLRLAGVGSVIGVAAVAAGGRIIRASLYGIQPLDPLTIGTVCLVLGLVALAACWAPSRRAAATPPSIALRG